MAAIFHAKYLNRYFFLLKNREKLQNYKLKDLLLKLPTKWTFPISWSPLFSITDWSKKKKRRKHGMIYPSNGDRFRKNRERIFAPPCWFGRKLFQTRKQHPVLDKWNKLTSLDEDLKRPTGSTPARNLTLSNFRPFRSEINGALCTPRLPAKLFGNDVPPLSLDRISRRRPLE